MKIKHLFIGLFAVAAIVACQEEALETPSLEVTRKSLELTATEAEASFEVTANIAWTATADQDWVSIDPASGDASKEAVKVTVTAESNTGEARTATVTVKAGDLTKTIALAQAAEADEPPVFEVQALYMLGAACDTGWSLSQMTSFKKIDGVWVWEGNLKLGDFRFHLVKESNVWWPGFFPTTDGKVVYATNDGQVQNPYRVESDGYYKVIVDFVTETVVFERLGDCRPFIPEITELYMLGDGCDTGWSLDKMESFECIDGLWVWQGNLNPKGAFRFPLQKVPNEWWPCLVPSADGSSVALQSNEPNSVYRVPQAGSYKVTIDPNTGALYIEYLGPLSGL